MENGGAQDLTQDLVAQSSSSVSKSRKAGSNTTRIKESNKQQAPEDSASKSAVRGGTAAPGAHQHNASFPYREGDKIGAKDHLGDKWWEAKVLEVDTEVCEVLVHFIGWNGRHDEWIRMDSPRLQPVYRTSSRRHNSGSDNVVHKGPNAGPPGIKEFKSGDEVMALWRQGSRYPAKIIRLEPDGRYLIEFYDGYKKLLRPQNLRSINKEDQSFVEACKDDVKRLLDQKKSAPQTAASTESASQVQTSATAHPTANGTETSSKSESPDQSSASNVVVPSVEPVTAQPVSGRRARKSKFNVKEVLNLKADDCESGDSGSAVAAAATNSQPVTAARARQRRQQQPKSDGVSKARRKTPAAAPLQVAINNKTVREANSNCDNLSSMTVPESGPTLGLDTLGRPELGQTLSPKSDPSINNKSKKLSVPCSGEDSLATMLPYLDDDVHHLDSSSHDLNSTIDKNDCVSINDVEEICDDNLSSPESVVCISDDDNEDEEAKEAGAVDSRGIGADGVANNFMHGLKNDDPSRLLMMKTGLRLLGTEEEGGSSNSSVSALSEGLETGSEGAPSEKENLPANNVLFNHTANKAAASTATAVAKGRGGGRARGSSRHQDSAQQQQQQGSSSACSIDQTNNNKRTRKRKRFPDEDDSEQVQLLRGRKSGVKALKTANQRTNGTNSSGPSADAIVASTSAESSFSVSAMAHTSNNAINNKSEAGTAFDSVVTSGAVVNGHEEENGDGIRRSTMSSSTLHKSSPRKRLASAIENQPDKTLADGNSSKTGSTTVGRLSLSKLSRSRAKLPASSGTGVQRTAKDRRKRQNNVKSVVSDRTPPHSDMPSLSASSLPLKNQDNVVKLDDDAVVHSTASALSQSVMTEGGNVSLTPCNSLSVQDRGGHGDGTPSANASSDLRPSSSFSCDNNKSPPPTASLSNSSTSIGLKPLSDRQQLTAAVRSSSSSAGSLVEPQPSSAADQRQSFPYLQLDLERSPEELSHLLVEGYNIPAVGRPFWLYAPHLPPGFRKKVVIRNVGQTRGKWDVLLENKEGRTFKSKQDLVKHLVAKKMEYDINHSDFSLCPTLKKIRQLWRYKVGFEKDEGKPGAAAGGNPADGGKNGCKKDVVIKSWTAVTASGSPNSKKLSSSASKMTAVGGSPSSTSNKRKRNGKLAALSVPSICTSDAESSLSSTSSSLCAPTATTTTSDSSPLKKRPATESAAVSDDGGELSTTPASSLPGNASDKQGVRCPLTNCYRLFRNEALLVMHVKHYHPGYCHLMGGDSAPSVTDMAFHRVRVGDNLGKEYETNGWFVESLKKAEKRAETKQQTSTPSSHSQVRKRQSGSGADIVTSTPTKSSAGRNSQSPHAATTPTKRSGPSRGRHHSTPTTRQGDDTDGQSDDEGMDSVVAAGGSPSSSSLMLLGNNGQPSNGNSDSGGHVSSAPTTPQKGSNRRQRSTSLGVPPSKEALQQQQNADGSGLTGVLKGPARGKLAATKKSISIDESSVKDCCIDLPLASDMGHLPGRVSRNHSISESQSEPDEPQPGKAKGWNRRRKKSVTIGTSKLAAVDSPAAGDVPSLVETTKKRNKEKVANEPEVMTEEEIVVCACGRNEGDGLMMQCDLCLTWQHAHCLNITQENQVPDKYICATCTSPRAGRSSQLYNLDPDWLRQGALTTIASSPSSDERQRDKTEKLMAQLHEVMTELVSLSSVLQTLQVKLTIAANPTHPKVFMWSSPWEPEPEPEPTPTPSIMDGDSAAVVAGAVGADSSLLLAGAEASAVAEAAGQYGAMWDTILASVGDEETDGPCTDGTSETTTAGSLVSGDANSGKESLDALQAVGKEATTSDNEASKVVDVETSIDAPGTSLPVNDNTSGTTTTTEKAMQQTPGQSSSIKSGQPTSTTNESLGNITAGNTSDTSNLETRSAPPQAAPPASNETPVADAEGCLDAFFDFPSINEVKELLPSVLKDFTTEVVQLASSDANAGVATDVGSSVNPAVVPVAPLRPPPPPPTLIPEPKLISREDSRLNLVSHIEHLQALLEERLNLVELHLDWLESTAVAAAEQRAGSPSASDDVKPPPSSSSTDLERVQAERVARLIADVTNLKTAANRLHSGAASLMDN